jgi:cellobiose phosphorylase
MSPPTRRPQPEDRVAGRRPTHRTPQVALLSNGAYSVMITDAGAGASTWRNLDITRWREDSTRDCWGQFIYVRDPRHGMLWSVGHQPLPQLVDDYHVAFHPDRAEFRRRDGDVETCWAVCVARDHDAEMRLVTLVNHGGRARELDLTSYAEVCLNARSADQGHPAFASFSSRPSSSLALAPCWHAAGRGPRTKSLSGPST